MSRMLFLTSPDISEYGPNIIQWLTAAVNLIVVFGIIIIMLLVIILVLVALHYHRAMQPLTIENTLDGL
jgi:phosphoglycerol transferase MdoB-like AlkP superfamily enzyme